MMIMVTSMKNSLIIKMMAIPAMIMMGLTVILGLMMAFVARMVLVA